MLIIILVLIIGGFHSILLHGQRLVVNFTHVAALCRCGSEQISSNYTHVQPSTRSIPMRNTLVNPRTALYFQLTTKR